MSAEKIIYEANLIKLEEANNNLTKYKTEMDPQILALKQQITTNTYYKRNATMRYEHF